LKIIIDNSNLSAGGGIQVARSFLYDLNSLKLSHDFHVIQSYNFSKQIDKTVFSSNFHFYDLNEIDKVILSRVKKVRALENAIKPNVIFTVFGPSYHRSKFPRIVGLAIPYLIYKNSPFFNEISCIEKIYYKVWGALKRYFFVKNSDFLVFETEDARMIFVNSIQKEIKSFTVGNTLNEVFLNDRCWKDFTLIPSTKFNILVLTANYPHKNLKIIPKIIDKLLEVYKFNHFRFIISLTKEELGFHDRYDDFITYAGKVDIVQIPSLYQNIDILLMPTLLEVFSTTYLEAMFMGKPIICSDMGFARNICANAALYCEPISEEVYARNIYKLYHDDDLRLQLVENGYRNIKRFGSSLDRTKAYLRIIEDILKNKKNENKE
jgi:glycosyltransferase involved in cell wall biosynthesis